MPRLPQTSRSPLGLALLLLLIAGCASQTQRRAWEQWAAAASLREMSGAPPTAPAMAERHAAASGLSSEADSSDLRHLTLREMQSYALRHNPELAAAHERWRAQLERIAPARTLPDPILTYGYFAEAVETRVGPQRQRIGLTQSLPWFGTLGLRGKVAALAADEGAARYATLRADLRRRVSTAYHELRYLERAARITEQNLDLLRDLEEVVLARYRGGAAAHASVIRTQIRLTRL
ncbi:MAG: hypothetical protein GF330_10680, partial [Candidatus Eisenbacteria bacterium]|nr:hypothetical protein [Candidatus Eisenbacteria bacterium]